MNIILYNKELENHLTQFDDFKTISIENKENPFLVMSNLKNCNELHLLAHGSPGNLDLGSGINTKALYENAEYLASLNVQKIILWGCHVGKNKEFIKTFSNLTNSVIYSSKDYLGKNKGMSDEFPTMNDFVKSLPFYLGEKSNPKKALEIISYEQNFDLIATYPDQQYTDTGDYQVEHDLTNNINEPIVMRSKDDIIDEYRLTGKVGDTLGFRSLYIPVPASEGDFGIGLTDGDYFGVTDYLGTVEKYPSMSNGFQLSDTDGRVQLIFDEIPVDKFNKIQIELSMFVRQTGWEVEDHIIIGVNDEDGQRISNIVDTTGDDINDESWLSGALGEWHKIFEVILENQISKIQLFIELKSNS